MKLFSIITICKNDLDNLKKTVKSVAIQNFKNYEYLIVDGGSNDGSLDYIKSIRNIKYISEPDNGIYDAMNKGINISNGSYICFMNSGDVFYDKVVLSNIAKQIKKNTKIDFLYGDVVCPKSKSFYMRHPKKITEFFLYRTGICHQAWFIRKKIYKKIGGFNLSYKFLSDYDVLLKVILKKKIHYKHISLFVANYKGEGFSLSDIKTNEKEKEIIHKVYFTKRENFYYSFYLKVINFFRRILFYDKLKNIYNELYFIFSKNYNY